MVDERRTRQKEPTSIYDELRTFIEEWRNSLKTNPDPNAWWGTAWEAVDMVEELMWLLEGSEVELPEAERLLHQRGREMMDRINENRDDLVMSKEEASVKELDRQLKPAFPRPTPRYAEIAQRLDMSADRVRYILEGPRRKKKK